MDSNWLVALLIVGAVPVYMLAIALTNFLHYMLFTYPFRNERD